MKNSGTSVREFIVFAALAAVGCIPNFFQTISFWKKLGMHPCDGNNSVAQK